MKTALLLIVLAPSIAFAGTYYMRADGTAENKATATACSSVDAAMSVSTHNSETFSAGDIINLCDDGGEYKGTIVAPSSGSAGDPITYRNALGDTPVIDISYVISNSGWSDVGEGKYQKTGYAAFGRVFWEDGVPLPAGNDDNVTTGNWYYNGGIFTYKPTSGTPSDHTLKAIWWNNPLVSTDHGIDIRNKSNLIVSGITFNYSPFGVGHGQDLSSPVSPISNIIIDNNSFNYVYWAIWSEVKTNGIESDVTITNNRIDYCNSGISSWTGSDETEGHSQHHTRYTITGNIITNHYSITPTKVWSDALLTSYYYTDHEGISFQDVQDSTISNNIISTSFDKYFTSDEYWTRAIYFYLTGNGVTQTTGNIISKNYIYGHFYPAIYISTASGFPGYDNNVFSYNVLRYDGVNATNDHISFETNSTSNNPASGTNYFLNNSIYNTQQGLGLYMYNRYDGKWVIRNNIIHSPGHALISVYNDNTSTLTIDHNIYDNPGSFQWGGTGGEFSGWQAHGYDSTGSLAADPLYVSSSDLRLLPSSPAINAGTDVGLTADYLGNPIVGLPDIGAYEYQPIVNILKGVSIGGGVTIQ